MLDPETLKPAREPISLKECAPHAMAVISLGGELFVADDTYWVGHRRSEQEKQAHTRVVVISEAGELKRNMPLPICSLPDITIEHIRRGGDLI